MNKFKTSFVALLVAFAAFGAKAQESYVKFYVNPDEIKVTDGLAQVNLWYDTDLTHLNATDFKLYLPTGFTVQKNASNRFALSINRDAAEDHSFTVGDHSDATDPYYTFVGLSMNNYYLATGNNRLISFNLVAPADFTATNYPEGIKCEFKEITIADNADTGIQSYHPEDFSFTILPHDLSTGVAEIGVDSGEEIIYNLQGIRVERPLAPGLYIINGEKTMVK